MKIKLILPVLFVLFPFFIKAQITVTCDNKVGLGNNNTSPVGSVDVLGGFANRPSSTGSYATFGLQILKILQFIPILQPDLSQLQSRRATEENTSSG
jgi:hypothetical protein